MKLSMNKLRSLIREHVLMNTVPDWIMTQAIDDMVKVIEQSLNKFILMHKSTDRNTSSTAEIAAKEMIEGFRKDIKDCFAVRLEEFKNKI